MDERLGQLLVKMGLLTQAHVADAMALPRRPGERLGQLLVRMGMINAGQLAQALAKQFKVPVLEAAEAAADPAAMAVIGLDFAKANACLPLKLEDGTLTVALVDPLNIDVIDEIGRITHLRVRTVVGEPKLIEDAIARAAGARPKRRQIRRAKDRDALLNLLSTSPPPLKVIECAVDRRRAA